MSISVSKNAIDKMNQLKKENPHCALFLTMLPGGCGDLTSVINFEKDARSLELEQEERGFCVVDNIKYIQEPNLDDDFKLFTDKRFKRILGNSSIDFISSIAMSSFVVKIPEATYKCGCGKSFGLDLKLLSGLRTEN